MSQEQVVWGFMLENTLFTKFEEHNHVIIENAYKQRKSKQASHYVHITDMNLPKPYKAKVYFGVVQNHLRMPGTRYYVNRKVITTSHATVTPSSDYSMDPFYSIDFYNNNLDFYYYYYYYYLYQQQQQQQEEEDFNSLLSLMNYSYN